MRERRGRFYSINFLHFLFLDTPECIYYSKIKLTKPWLVWLSRLSTSLPTKGLLVRFPVRAHAWVTGQVPSEGCARGNHTLTFLFFSSPSFPLYLKINKKENLKRKIK